MKESTDVNQSIVKRIADFITIGENASDYGLYKKWQPRVETYLNELLGEDIAKQFAILSSSQSNMPSVLGFLEALAVKLQGFAPTTSSSNKSPLSSDGSSATIPMMRPVRASDKVFIVHGHDVAAKETVARFIEKLGLKSVILHEQPNLGQTVIEKFELFADVQFAVVLLTPDDIGYSVGKETAKRKRARQNVVLELGYFLGKLGRKNICALCVGDVEIPSDYQGVVYIKMDEAGAWRTKLAQEFVQAGMNINLQGIL